MKNMQKFAAQQLTKSQMNDVKGGTVNILCPIIGADGKILNYVYASGKDFFEASQKIASEVDSTGYSSGECEFV